MIKSLSSPHGIDIFHLNSFGHLTHEWSRDQNQKDLFSRVITSKKVIGSPSIIASSEDIFHVYYVTEEKTLRNVQFNISRIYEKKST